MKTRKKVYLYGNLYFNITAFTMDKNKAAPFILYFALCARLLLASIIHTVFILVNTLKH